MAEDERYDLDQRINHRTNESLDATDRILQVAQKTNQIGVETLVTLNKQGEQLGNIERRQHEIKADLKHADGNLTRLEQFCGCFTCPCGRPRSIQKKKNRKKAQQMEDVVSAQPTGSGGGGARGPYVKRVTNDDREDKMEENLQATSHILGNLKGIATEIGTEIDRQNDQLDHIDRINEDNISHLDQAIYRIGKQH